MSGHRRAVVASSTDGGLENVAGALSVVCLSATSLGRPGAPTRPDLRDHIVWLTSTGDTPVTALGGR